MRIRDAEPKDLESVTHLFKELDLMHLDNHSDFKSVIVSRRYTKIFNKVFDDCNYILRVVEINNNQITGFCLSKLISISKNHIYKDQKVGEITYVFVNQKFKGKGIGGELLKDAEKRLKKIGADKIEIRVFSFNKSFVPENYGFKKKYSVYEKE